MLDPSADGRILATSPSVCGAIAAVRLPCRRIETQVAAMTTETKGLQRLTEREREILRLIHLRHSVKSAAARLDRAPGTVETHLKRIREKLGVSRSSDAADMLADFERSSIPVPDDQVPRSTGIDEVTRGAAFRGREQAHGRPLERPVLHTAPTVVGAARSDPWRHRHLSEGRGDRSLGPVGDREDSGLQALFDGLDRDPAPRLRGSGRAWAPHLLDGWGGTNELGALEKLGWVAATMIAIMMAFGGLTYGLSFLSAHLPRS